MTDWAAIYQDLLSGDTIDSVDTKAGIAPTLVPAIVDDGIVCVNRVNCVTGEPGARSAQAPAVAYVGGGGASPSLFAAFTVIERQCPDGIELSDWRRAVEDGRGFIIQWGEEAERLGWTAEDLFGLPEIPERPAWDWHRLARIDQVGLVWLLHGRKVVALSADQAVIATPSEASIRSASYPRSIQRGTIAFYRRGRIGHG